jgi:hypothetical protein
MQDVSDSEFFTALIIQAKIKGEDTSVAEKYLKELEQLQTDYCLKRANLLLKLNTSLGC